MVSGRKALRRFRQLFDQVGDPVGSHYKFRNPDTGKTCEISIHVGEDVPRGTLASALAQIGISDTEFFDGRDAD